MKILHKCPSETYFILWYVCFLQLIALEDLIHEWLFICLPDQCRREATIQQKIIIDGFIDGPDNFRSGFVTFFFAISHPLTQFPARANSKNPKIRLSALLCKYCNCQSKLDKKYVRRHLNRSSCNLAAPL